MSHLQLSADLVSWLEDTCDSVELVAFEEWQPAHQKDLFDHLRAIGKRVSVHGPGDNVEPVLDAVIRTFGLDDPSQEDVRVVGHADVVTRYAEAWEPVGEALLIENLGELRDPDARLLREAFERHPQAQLCIDVSHELNTAVSLPAGVEHLWELVEIYPVGQVHFGCYREMREGRRYTALETVAAEVLEWARWIGSEFDVPVVLEGGNSEPHRPIELAEASRLLNVVASSCECAHAAV